MFIRIHITENAYWDGSSERLRKIYFFNLPSDCEITIYTLSGDIVKRIEHDQKSNGSNIRWFQNYASDGKQQMIRRRTRLGSAFGL